MKVITLNESDEIGGKFDEVPDVPPDGNFIKIEGNINPDVFDAITKLIEATGGNYRVLE